MRPKSLAILMLAVGCGLVAMIGVMQLLGKKNADSDTQSGNMQAIFVAMTDIGMGDLLTPQVLKLEQWPKDKIPPGAIARIQDIEGRRARTRLYANEPILDNKLLGKGASQQGATAMIPRGFRVVPVKVDLVSGGSSLILPGDRVDVMVHLIRDPARDIQETVTRTILQDIKVFAVNDVLDMEKDGGKSIIAKTISLLVTPEQAAQVSLATQMGSVNLVMRSPEDDQAAPNAEAKPGHLTGVPSKADRAKEEPLPPEPKPIERLPQVIVASVPVRDTWTMRIVKPGTVDEASFETDDSPGAATSPSGGWRPTGSSSTGGAPPKDEPTPEEPKVAAPPQQAAAPPKKDH